MIAFAGVECKRSGQNIFFEPVSLTHQSFDPVAVNGSRNQLFANREQHPHWYPGCLLNRP